MPTFPDKADVCEFLHIMWLPVVTFSPSQLNDILALYMHGNVLLLFEVVKYQEP